MVTCTHVHSVVQCVHYAVHTLPCTLTPHLVVVAPCRLVEGPCPQGAAPYHPGEGPCRALVAACPGASLVAPCPCAPGVGAHACPCLVAPCRGRAAHASRPCQRAALQVTTTSNRSSRVKQMY
jgi:hypothetical protein